ncbi:MAG: DUF2784 domain-containing protein [Bacteroidetes bacterium]|nr:DUF2784 domain-containing protein [Bacteroidota bacterium]
MVQNSRRGKGGEININMLYRGLFYLTVIGHLTIVVANVLSVFWLLWFAPWYVCFPVISFVLNLSVNRWVCPLTMLENYFRGKLKLPLIHGFIGHYFFKTIPNILKHK